MGRDVNENRWHVDVIKSSLTPNLPSIFPELLDELPLAVQDNLLCEDGNEVFQHFKRTSLKRINLLGWTAVNVFPAVLNIVARLSSRIFVGLPLCESVIADSCHKAHVTMHRSFSAVHSSRYPLYCGKIERCKHIEIDTFGIPAV